MNTKTCCVCGNDLPLSSFGKHKSGGNGIRGACKECTNKRQIKDKQYAKEYYMKNKERIKMRSMKHYANKSQEEKDKVMERVRGWRIKKQYGITREMYFEMHNQQGGTCRICGREDPSGRELSIDHDHLTGKVRALLCCNCNRSLGWMGEDSERLRIAADYLDFHKNTTSTKGTP